MQSRNEALVRTISELDRRYGGPVFVSKDKMNSERIAIITGQEQVDELIGGFPVGINLIVGGPGVGKSLLTVVTAAHEAESGRCVLAISSEEPIIASWFAYFPRRYRNFITHPGGELDIYQVYNLVKEWSRSTRKNGLPTNTVVIDSFNGLLAPAEARITLSRELKGNGREFTNREIEYASLAQVERFVTNLSWLAKREDLVVLMPVHDWRTYSRRSNHQVGDEDDLSALGITAESEDNNRWPVSDYDIGVMRLLLGNASSVCRLGFPSGFQEIEWVGKGRGSNCTDEGSGYFILGDYQLGQATAFRMGIEVIKSPFRHQNAGQVCIPFAAVPGFSEHVSRWKNSL